MRRHAVVIEKADKGFSGYAPDLPRCPAAAPGVAKVKAARAEALPFHLEELRADGTPVPLPEGVVEWVEV